MVGQLQSCWVKLGWDTLQHGFNRTGAMLVHYLQRTRPWPKLNEHIAEFAMARPPGIYKPDYVRELFDEYLERRFRTTKDPGLPEWKRGAAVTDAPPLDDAAGPPGQGCVVQSRSFIVLDVQSRSFIVLDVQSRSFIVLDVQSRSFVRST